MMVSDFARSLFEKSEPCHAWDIMDGGILITRLTLGLYVHISTPFFNVPFPLSFAGAVIVKILFETPWVQLFMVMVRSQSGR